MNNQWISYSAAVKALPAKLLARVRREFGTNVKVQKFEVVVDRENDTGKLTFSTIMVRVKRRKLADLIAVLCGKTWRYFTDELHAQKAFFGSLKPST